ncbi:MAG: hypothetical protein RL748_372 [Pseudomonadota bacterium]|jgi:cell division protein ZapA
MSSTSSKPANSSAGSAIALDVFIMGQSYKLMCKPGEETALREAVAYLDGKMCAIRDSGKVKGTDRIAVMAALGIAAEFLSAKSPQGPFADMSVSEVRQKIAKMNDVLDQALTPQENLF